MRQRGKIQAGREQAQEVQRESAQAADVEELFAHQGVSGYGSTPEEFRKVKHNIDKWAKVIRTANIRIE